MLQTTRTDQADRAISEWWYPLFWAQMPHDRAGEATPFTHDSVMVWPEEFAGRWQAGDVMRYYQAARTS